MQVGMDTEAAGSGGASVFDLPKLDPKMLNERARIWLPDPGSIRLQYVHGLGGKKAQQPGMPEPGWGGNWLCTGRDAVLKASNPALDPEVCFMCREHQNGNPLVAKSQRKFIVQVLRYNTDPSGNLLQPFGATLLVWQFSDKQYRALVEVANAWGDLRQHDLMLVCDNIGFKSWTLQPLPEVAFMRDASWTQLVTQVVQSQAVPGEDLERILGRGATNDQEIMAKLAEITPASMAPPVAYQAPAIPGMPPGMMPGMAPQPGMMPPAMPAPAGPPAMVPPAQAAYAQAPPAEALYPPGGPFDQAQQVMGQQAPPAMPGMMPPPMPAAPAPAQLAPVLPGVPDLPQQNYQVPGQQLAPPAMPAPAPAPPAMPQVPGVPDLTQPPPPAQPVPQQVAPPPMVPPPAAPAQPGAPAAPTGPTDLAALMAAPPPPPPA